ncbi:MAG: Unknown protein [uncultured Sulfurovum sp.]|uniref:Glycosyltransferase 2-like domain-containing protein n=1 Tax=uncultured Sulfurovum sp. TaxID=269237 RepID=A0A6S6TR09_9BACT|nr:MAG: Unknown protein [uncultured Sulfurovum sp.]
MEYVVKMIKFSVVIPLYNKEEDIINTLTSVLNQSYEVDEVIVVDDGSTDSAVRLINEEFKDMINVVSQKNMGVSSARNRGILEARNEYICLLDGDDLWEQGFLEEIVKLIEVFPHATFYSTAHTYMNEDGNLLEGKVSKHEDRRSLTENFSETFRTNYRLVNSSSVCIRKSSKVIFPEAEQKGEDICVWLELGRKGSLAYSSNRLSIYRLNGSNRSVSVHSEAIVPCPLKWFYKNKEKLQNEKNYESIRKFIYSNILITVYGGFALSKNYQSISSIIQLMKKQNDRFYLLLYPAYLVPLKLLEILKKLRRKMK